MSNCRRGTAKFATLAVALWLVALVAAPVAATVMVEVPVEDMARDANAVIHGIVERSGTQMQLSGGDMEPRTVTRIRVREWLKGSGSETVTVREIGGAWVDRSPNGETQGGGYWIDGTPRYAPGEEVIVFLRQDPENSRAYRTYAMVQGKYVVTRGVPGVPSRVTRDVSSIAFAQLGNPNIEAHRGPEAAYELDTFLEHLRRVIAYGGAR